MTTSAVEAQGTGSSPQLAHGDALTATTTTHRCEPHDGEYSGEMDHHAGEHEHPVGEE